MRVVTTLLDANYFLRWFLNDVPTQNREVNRLLAQSRSQSLVLAPITVAEITYVLRGMGYNHRQIYTAITEFGRQPALRPLEENLSKALDIYNDTMLDFEDCWLAVQSMKGRGVATFDKNLQKKIAQLATLKG